MADPFPTTHWSELAALRDQNPDGTRLLVARLYERYWTPLYAYLRRRGNDPERAADLLQGFFAFLLDKEVFARLNPQGRLRAYLLASLKNFVADQYDRQKALKRQPAEPLLSLDFELAERLYLQVASSDLTPDQEYERRWALLIMQRATERLAESERLAGRGRDFELLRPHVVGGAAARPYRELAEALQLSESAVKVRVHRMRKRLGTYLRQDVQLTVPESAAVAGELEHLRGLLG